MRPPTPKQSPKSSAISVPPWLPPEIISFILTKLWEAPQSQKQRSALLRNIPLVNRTWLALFVRAISRNVHLFCPAGADAFLRILPARTLLQGGTDLFTLEASQTTDQVCHSITFHVDKSASPTSDPGDCPSGIPPSDAMSTAVSTVLYMVTSINYLPNLRHVSIQYKDWGYDDIFDQLRFQTFPPQVIHLSVDYSFSTPGLAPLLIYLKSMSRPYSLSRVKLPSIQHLSLSSVPMEFVLDMLQVCPNVETLEVADPGRLHTLAPLPPSVHTLILRHPAVALSRSQMMAWTLFTALEGGLFVRDVQPRIIVRSGTPDPVAFIELWRSCKRFNAQIVYERDDMLS